MAGDKNVYYLNTGPDINEEPNIELEPNFSYSIGSQSKAVFSIAPEIINKSQVPAKDIEVTVQSNKHLLSIGSKKIDKGVFKKIHVLENLKSSGKIGQCNLTITFDLTGKNPGSFSNSLEHKTVTGVTFYVEYSNIKGTRFNKTFNF